MRPGKRFRLSAVQKSELWRRWKAGQSLHGKGRMLPGVAIFFEPPGDPGQTEEAGGDESGAPAEVNGNPGDECRSQNGSHN